MRVAVFGAGGVGGFFGARLATSGHDVTFIARGEHLEAIKRNGLRVESSNGNFTVNPASATSEPNDVAPVDVVLVGVKAWQVTEAAEQMRPLIGQKTVVIPLQNGVEAPERLGRVLGTEHVVGGLCKIVSFIAAPGVIRHAGMEPFIAFGDLDGSQSKKCERVRDAFLAAGIRAEIPSSINVAMWRKFIFISSFSGVAAVTRAPAGPLRSISETRAMLVEALKEAVAVANASGVSLSEDAVKAALETVDGLPEHGTASMQRDIMEGRPSELEEQNGAVVRLGREAGVASPVHSFIYASLLPAEMAARSLSS